MNTARTHRHTGFVLRWFFRLLDGFSSLSGSLEPARGKRSRNDDVTLIPGF
jgi:hypothetical protein